MSIKNEILREAGVSEATTFRVDGENVKFDNVETNTLKGLVDGYIDDIAEHISGYLEEKNKTISEKEARKQAESFFKNYLKGVYGK